jgi:hypothetical protein
VSAPRIVASTEVDPPSTPARVTACEDGVRAVWFTDRADAERYWSWSCLTQRGIMINPDHPNGIVIIERTRAPERPLPRGYYLDD